MSRGHGPRGVGRREGCQPARRAGFQENQRPPRDSVRRAAAPVERRGVEPEGTRRADRRGRAGRVAHGVQAGRPVPRPRRRPGVDPRVDGGRRAHEHLERGASRGGIGGARRGERARCAAPRLQHIQPVRRGRARDPARARAPREHQTEDRRDDRRIRRARVDRARRRVDARRASRNRRRRRRVSRRGFAHVALRSVRGRGRGRGRGRCRCRRVGDRIRARDAHERAGAPPGRRLRRGV